MRSRLLTAVAGLLVSLGLSAAAWFLFDTLFLLFVVPFVPFLLWRGGGRESARKECPVCGFRAADPEHDYCPRDGHRLEREDATASSR